MNYLVHKKILYTLIILFIAINGYLIYKEFFYLPLLPIILLTAAVAFFRADILLYIIVFCTPLSINLNEFDIKLGIFIPTEPMIIGLMIFYILKKWHESKGDTAFLKHPISLLLIGHLIWLFITAITSALPVVSFKFFAMRLWYIFVFYFVIYALFKQTKGIRTFLWMYLLGIIVVIFYTLHNHYIWGLTEDAAHWVMSPFYKDHTSYGALLAMFLPILFLFIGLKKEESNTYVYNSTIRYLLIGITLLFSLALVLSYTRAAWLSLVGALGLYLILKLRINYKLLLIPLLIGIGVLIHQKDNLYMLLEKNKQDSSENIVEHVQSISNVSSDASNLERLNRWNSAIRMFEERPIFGWGPGTYQFIYGPFQKADDLTIISTNAGNMGNAHSEYIGPLAETGLIGAMSILSLVIGTLMTGIKVYKESKNKEIKAYALFILLGLSTYFIHGGLNNFLDTDKMAVPFFGMIAMLVALDIYHTKERNTELT